MLHHLPHPYLYNVVLQWDTKVLWTLRLALLNRYINQRILVSFLSTKHDNDALPRYIPCVKLCIKANNNQDKSLMRGKAVDIYP